MLWQPAGGAAATKPQGPLAEPKQVLRPRAVRGIKSLWPFIKKWKKLHLLAYKKPAQSPGFFLISKCFSINREGGGQMAGAFGVLFAEEFRFREKGGCNDFLLNST